jgi:uncharacterized membrane protein YccC
MMSRLLPICMNSKVWKKLSILEHPARTAIGAVVSLLVARLFKLPEAYWAPITTILAMQSTLGTALKPSSERFAGTAMGAAVGGLVGSFVQPTVAVWGLSVFCLGILCALFGLNRNAYRLAGLTVTIIMLMNRSSPAWVVAIHRFIEVSIGITIALAMCWIWPESEEGAKPANA